MKNIKFQSSFLFLVGILINTLNFAQSNPVPQQLPCLHIMSQNSANMNGMYSNKNCIYVGGETNLTTIDATGNNQVNLRSGRDIKIEPNTHILNHGNGRSHAWIETSLIDAVWYEPNTTPGFVGRHERIELGFKLPENITALINLFLSNGTSGINPFDPDQIDFRVHLTAPNGSTMTRFAFYYKPFIENLSGSGADPSTYNNEFVQDTTSFPWRFRFAPPTTGLWKVNLEIIIPGSTNITQTGATFVCIPSNHKGLLKVSNNGDDSDRWMYYSQTGEPFFAISENIASAGEFGYLPSQNKRHLEGLQKLIDVGGNFTRFELGGQSALPDWPVYNNYKGKLDEMYAFDKMVTKCEDNNVYFTLFRHHVEVQDRADWAEVKWQENPYKLALNLDIFEYFEDGEVIEWQNKCLRYIYSRWGYSPNMTFYSYSEVDTWYEKMFSESIESGSSTNDAKYTSRYKLRTWIYNQQEYIKSTLNNNAMFCHSPEAPDGTLENNPIISFFELSDVVGLHLYGDHKDINYKIRFDQIEEYWNKFNKPILLEEMGPNLTPVFCCTGIEFHNSVWSTAMMGSFGAGMDWWWDGGVFDFGYQIDLLRIKNFFQGENLIVGKYQPQKWDDVGLTFGSGYSMKHRKIENFALKSENKEHVLGWVHNATYYWRNLTEDNACLANLVNDQSSSNTPCYFGEDPHGYPYDLNGLAPNPQNHNDVYDHEINDKPNSAGMFNSNSFEDNYTNNGGAVPIQNQLSYVNNPTFEIHALKASGLVGKKRWYKIVFYHTGTLNGSSSPSLIATQEIHTNVWGTLKPHVPNLNEWNADYAYKVVYLGHYKNAILTEDSTSISEPVIIDKLEMSDDFLIIYPNPNNGEFQISCAETIKEIKIYNDKGEVVLGVFNLNTNKYDAKSNIESGIYIVQILTHTNVYVNKKIIVL